LCDRAQLRGRLAARSSGNVEHALTHRRLRVQLWPLRDAVAAADSSLRAVPLSELDALGVSRLTHKALQAAGLGPQLSLA
jgi:hypothetical protein